MAGENSKAWALGLSKAPGSQDKAACVPGGFTIPELLIATTVFSAVLVITMATFFIIGNLFFKGISVTQTQQDAKRILDAVTADIAAAPKSAFDPSPKDSLKGGGLKYICIGNARYSFHLNYKVDIGDHDTNNKFGLLRDVVQVCGDPDKVPLKNPEELLDNQVRLVTLQVTPSAAAADAGTFTSNIWDISIKVAYGSDEVFEAGSLPNNPTCVGNVQVSRFCAVTSLNTTVSQDALSSIASAESSGESESPPLISIDASALAAEGLGPPNVDVFGKVNPRGNSLLKCFFEFAKDSNFTVNVATVTNKNSGFRYTSKSGVVYSDTCPSTGTDQDYNLFATAYTWGSGCSSIDAPSLGAEACTDSGQRWPRPSGLCSSETFYVRLAVTTVSGTTYKSGGAAITMHASSKYSCP